MMTAADWSSFGSPVAMMVRVLGSVTTLTRFCGRP